MVDARTRELERKLDAYYKEKERAEHWQRRKAQLRKGVETIERGGRAVSNTTREVYHQASKGYSESYRQTRDVGRQINKQGGAPSMLGSSLFAPRPTPIANRGEGKRHKKGRKKSETRQKKGGSGILIQAFKPMKW